MSFETTLICDGCGRVLDGGSKRSLVTELQRNGGRAFRANRELNRRHNWERSSRHLGACCADKTEFSDGKPIPTKGQEGR